MTSPFPLDLTKLDLSMLNYDQLEKQIAKETQKCSAYQGVMNLGLYLLQLKLVSALKKLLDLVTSGESLQAIFQQLSKVALLYKIIDSESHKLKLKEKTDAQIQAQIEEHNKWLIAQAMDYQTLRLHRAARAAAEYAEQRKRNPISLKKTINKQREMAEQLLAQIEAFKAELLQKIFSQSPKELLLQRKPHLASKKPKVRHSPKVKPRPR